MSSKTLKASVIIGGSLAGSFRSAMSSTKNGLKAIGDEIAKAERKQRILSQSMESFGRVGGKVADKMRRDYEALVASTDKLRAAQKRLADAQARIDANRARRQQLGASLRQSTVQLGAVVAVSAYPVRAAIAFENAMLGVAKQVEGARDAGGKLTPVYFGMAKQIQRLGRELPMATNDIADMVTAGARMGIVRDELIGFVRDTSKMSTAFEMAPGELADSMGKVAKIFRIPVPAIGELGDAINYLDDNAISKGSDIIRVMQGDLAGAASTMGLSAKNAAALASTFLTLGESAERADTAAAGMMRQLQIAKMNPKRFQVGVKMLGLTGDQLQKGMIDDPQAMILDVLGRIKKLPVEQQMEAVTRLFGKDWGGAIAKLANGVDEYRRQLALANGEAAKGSMTREFQARMQTTSAQWQITKNRMTEVAVVIGGALLPAVNSLMQSAAPMIERFAEFSRNNPGAIKGIIGTALALTGLRVATLGVAYAWTAAAGPVLKIGKLFAQLRGAKAIAEAGGQVGRFAGMFLRVGSVVRTVGAAIAAIGGGPIALTVAALTAGALMVRKYWEPITAWIGGAMRGIGEVAGPVFAQLGAALAPLKPAWDYVSSAIGTAWGWIVKLLEPVNMTSAELTAAGESGRSFGRVLGAVMTAGVRAITSVVKAVTWVGQAIGTAAGFLVVNFGGAWDKVKSIVGAAVEWIMRKVQPILSVGSAIGNAVTGAAQWAFGDDGAAPRPAPRANLAMPAPARGRVAPRAPAVAARGGASVTDASTHNYNITQQPGESLEALAQRIEAERRKRAGVDRRGSLVDGVN